MGNRVTLFWLCVESRVRLASNAVFSASGRDETMLELLALSVVLILVAAIVLRVQQQAAHKRAESKPQSFRAVGIRVPAGACSAVREYTGKRFLGKEAPQLPVLGCSVAPCLCRYLHFADRRAEDRRVQYGVMNRLRGEINSDRRRYDRRQAVA